MPVEHNRQWMVLSCGMRVRTWCPTSQMILSFGKGPHSLCYDAKGRLAQVAMMILNTFIPYVWLVKHIVERHSELYNTEAEQKKFSSYTTKLGKGCGNSSAERQTWILDDHQSEKHCRSNLREAPLQPVRKM